MEIKHSSTLRLFLFEFLFSLSARLDIVDTKITCNGNSEWLYCSLKLHMLLTHTSFFLTFIFQKHSNTYCNGNFSSAAKQKVHEKSLKYEDHDVRDQKKLKYRKKLIKQEWTEKKDLEINFYFFIINLKG